MLHVIEGFNCVIEYLFYFLWKYLCVVSALCSYVFFVVYVVVVFFGVVTRIFYLVSCCESVLCEVECVCSFVWLLSLLCAFWL